MSTPRTDASTTPAAPALTLDHLALFAPTLEAGVAYVRDVLGVEPSPGGRHDLMATHNRLIRLGADQFLEIIAADPTGAPKTAAGAPWFELGDIAATAAHWTRGQRLRGMVARTSNLATVIAVRPDELGVVTSVSRGQRQWTFGVRADGQLPGAGTLPHAMDWGTQGPAGPALPDLGCRLLDLVLETPADHDAVTADYAALGFVGAPRLTYGTTTRLIAAIDTPRGVRILT
jgi:hypothetical protein